MRSRRSFIRISLPKYKLMLENWIWSCIAITSKPQIPFPRCPECICQLSWHPLEFVIRSKSFRPFVSKIWMKHKSLLGSVRFSLLPSSSSTYLTWPRVCYTHERHTRPTNMKYFIYIFTIPPPPPPKYFWHSPTPTSRTCCNNSILLAI